LTNRILDDWLDSYLLYTDNSEPLKRFRRWSALSAIAAGLQRKCFLQWEKQIYPNLYVLLVSPPGSRKGTAMGPAIALLREAGVQLAPNSATREAIIKEMASNPSSTIIPNKGDIPLIHSSITIFSEELSVFLDQRDEALMKALIEWYDCPSPWAYQTISRGLEYIEGVWVNLIGATTPGLIQTILPQSSSGAGLTSRIIFVYGKGREKRVWWPQKTQEELVLGDKLCRDLESIVMMYGEFTMTRECLDVYAEWYQATPETTLIEDSHLVGYQDRRSTHLRKLCMILSASRSSDMIIKLQDFHRALGLLEEIEPFMPSVFQSFGRLPTAIMVQPVLDEIHRQGQISFTQLAGRFHKDLTEDELRAIVRSLTQIESVELVREDGNDFVRFC